MKVMVAMSGGVDSSVAALLLRDQGHEVVGVTLRLWGGESDSGCCSVSDVDDARRCAQQIGIDHQVFNFGDDFQRTVVDPYVDSHRVGSTPNPCVECNRHLKFDRLIRRARMLGFDALATGHHARIDVDPSGRFRVGRGADVDKDQSYVVHMLDSDVLDYVLFPVGEMNKTEVRALAERHGLRTAGKPDSQDVCFIGSTVGRAGFLRERIEFTPAVVVDEDGRELSRVEAVQLVTIGQRRGLQLGGRDRHYVVDVDVDGGRVVVAPEERLSVATTEVESVVWPYPEDRPRSATQVLVQSSAHGAITAATIVPHRDDERSVTVRWESAVRRIAPGQSVVFYDLGNQFVIGGGIVSC